MTFGKGLKSAEDTVSIHATLAGGDWFTFPLIEATTECFYPRHPRGWRHRQSTAWTGGTMFLSTPPSRVATQRYPHYRHRGTVSIHATLAGGDRARRASNSARVTFLSTPPSRVATVGQSAFANKPVISIHATLAGGDGRTSAPCPPTN